MINIYPANRLENLVFLLERVMQTSNANVLSEEIILVQSKGMQHWLNLKLADSRGISMNLSFSLPMAFFWNQIRAVLGKETVPEQSSYTREVLSWRLYDLLASDEVIQNSLCQEPVNYYFNAKGDDAEKRFQLASQLADLFEQYLIFRPDWLLSWEQGNLKSTSCSQHDAQQWQAILWNKLVAQEPLHPIHLLKQAILKLRENHVHLPERISLFGINTLPPLWLKFLSDLGQKTDVHFFHLNPCVEYWGDLKTDKNIAKEQFYRWIKSQDIIDETEVTNPLLSNLGAQGKDFLYLLQEYTNIEIPVFELPEEASNESGEKITILQTIQTDILNLHDARHSPSPTVIDDSIALTTAHSALREIQALHDWLLHQINDDASLTPKDILVMCPNVEDYAPYVDAVFAHGWNDWSEQIPPLPCSIADRTLKDSEPLVQAFSDLLELPDSRFQVSQILSYLRLPALQQKFSFSEDDLLLLERWIQHAAIHWGLDAEHKKKILTSDEQTNHLFTWHQGLERLLLGFAYADQDALYQEQLLLSDVEGDEAVLLGRYFELLEQLQICAKELLTERTPEQWKVFLLKTKDSFFSTIPVDSNAQQIIEQAIDDLGEYASHAHYDKPIPLTIVRDFLSHHFSQAEPGRQFMAGQVTFCSMVPMRSVPFRVIAVLGLNDGEFPRQRQPMGFDLMAMESPRKGDRSRRGDDRYLFLEALISCRDKLYLSYQGHDIKTNNTREPSLVLQEFVDYLEKGYGWDMSLNSSEQLFKVPLQAFSKDNYQGTRKSFNAEWLKLSEASNVRNNRVEINEVEFSDELTLEAEQLVKFFDHPSKLFSQHRLGLYLDNNDSILPDDSEPFVTNHLDRYLIQESIIKTELSDDVSDQVRNDLIHTFKLSGTLPDTPDTMEELNDWQEQALDFAKLIKSEEASLETGLNLTPVNIMIDNIQLNAELPLIGNRLFYWRLASAKGKDDIRLWIHHLIAQVALNDITTQGLFRAPKKTKNKGGDELSAAVIYFEPESVDWAREQLSSLLQCWKEGMQKPLLLNASLGQKHCMLKQDAKKKVTNKPLTESHFSAFWNDDFQTQGLGSDPYMKWFWGDDSAEPQWENNWQLRVEKIYSPLYERRKESS